MGITLRELTAFAAFASVDRGASLQSLILMVPTVARSREMRIEQVYEMSATDYGAAVVELLPALLTDDNNRRSADAMGALWGQLDPKDVFK